MKMLVENEDVSIDDGSSTIDDDSDDDEENSSTASEDDDDDDEESSTLVRDLTESWKQHCIALIVAVVATVVAFSYQRLAHTKVNIIATKQAGRQRTLQTTTATSFDDDVSNNKHAHLEKYYRTANVTFCGGTMHPIMNKNLEIMDFHLPKNLIPTMAMHFQADYFNYNDNYNTLLQESSNAFAINNDNDIHPEIKCMKKLEQSTTSTFIKGVTYYYKRPSIETMYKKDVVDSERELVTSVKSNIGIGNTKIQEAHLTFTGFASKFVNMGIDPVLLFWDGRGGGEDDRRLVGEIAPFEALSTATRPGESFSVSPVYDHSHALQRWVVTIDDAIQYYEPAEKIIKQKPLSDMQQKLYNMQKLNQEFAKHYLIHSKRSWLSHFPRAFPVHNMWEANYFGQNKYAYSTYFDDEGKERKKRFTLEVVSVTPRVFKIKNFLSSKECDSLIQLAVRQGLQASTVFAGNINDKQRDRSTRSSSNTWLARDTAILTDQIYRRSANILNIDQQLLQAPIDDDVDAEEHSIAESLQVLRYRKGEQYTPHHDWVIPSKKHRHQPTRFATLLMYLNDDYEGGQTTFPRAINSQYHDGIKIQPEKGMAVLFYNMLPDGNVDDLSEHASEPVTNGEKFAANLWIWEPVIN